MPQPTYQGPHLYRDPIGGEPQRVDVFRSTEGEWMARFPGMDGEAEADLMASDLAGDFEPEWRPMATAPKDGSYRVLVGPGLLSGDPVELQVEHGADGMQVRGRTMDSVLRHAIEAADGWRPQ